jgi:quercetin dioxygenase-like cupin family protein
MVSGTALIGTRDGRILEAHPGDTVSCPPGEEHWHGAAPDRFMEHIALWEGTGRNDTPETVWAEHVPDAQYNGRRTRSR